MRTIATALAVACLAFAACGGTETKDETDKADTDKDETDKADTGKTDTGKTDADKAEVDRTEPPGKLAAVLAKPDVPAQPSSKTTGPGSWTRITKSDDYKTVIDAVVHDGKLFHAVKDGTFYATDLTTGAIETISRKPDFGEIRWLMHGGDFMISLESGGTVYKIGPDATREAMGKAGAYSDTIAATAGNGHLYTVEKDGTLYDTDLATMTWKTIGKSDYGNTRAMYAAAGDLFTVEKDGSVFHVNPADGKWYNVGANEAWKKTVAATYTDGTLFRVASSGTLYAVAASAKGTMTALGQPDFQHVRWMGASDNALITLEKDGSLYRVAIQ